MPSLRMTHANGMTPSMPSSQKGNDVDPKLLLDAAACLVMLSSLIAVLLVTQFLLDLYSKWTSRRLP